MWFFMTLISALLFSLAFPFPFLKYNDFQKTAMHTLVLCSLRRKGPENVEVFDQKALDQHVLPELSLSVQPPSFLIKTLSTFFLHRGAEG